MYDKHLALVQLCDSNFPTGAFSHSFGLESYIQEGIVYDEATFSKWLRTYLHEQLVYSDGLVARLVYEALEKNDVEKIWELDRMITVQNFARESREGSIRIAERMVGLTETLYNVPILAIYRKRMKEKKSFGHPAIVFTMVGNYLRLPVETTVLYYLYSSISSLVQNAVRAIPLGQTNGQKIIYSFQTELAEAVEKIQELSEEDIGIVSPGLELSQMEHEHLNIRIFMS